MSDKIKLHLPSMSEGQDSWQLLVPPSPLFPPYNRARTIRERVLYQTLSWIANKAEEAECWARSHRWKYAPDYRPRDVNTGTYSFRITRVKEPIEK